MFTEPRKLGQGHQLHIVSSSDGRDVTVIQVLLHQIVAVEHASPKSNTTVNHFLFTQSKELFKLFFKFSCYSCH